MRELISVSLIIDKRAKRTREIYLEMIVDEEFHEVYDVNEDGGRSRHFK